MKAVDRVKGIRGEAIDRLYPQGIVYHHVPKCGGTSVGRAIRLAYAGSQATLNPGATSRALVTVSGNLEVDEMELLAFRERLLAYLLHSGFRGVAAHVPFSTRVADEFAEQYRFVVVMRDPVERFVSHFLHTQRGVKGPANPALEEFLETEESELLGMYYARYFAGETLAPDDLAGRGVEMAITNLKRFDAVGFTDRLPQFESDLRRVTGKRIRIGRDNVNRQVDRRTEILEGPHRGRIEELCRPDQAVWEAAQQLR